MRPLSLLLALPVLVACTHEGPPVVTGRPTPAPVVWSGQVSFEARVPSARGASAELQVRPARHVRVEIVDRGGRALARALTDAEGRFALEAPSDAARLHVLAATDVDGHVLSVSRAREGDRPHLLALALGDPAEPMTILADDADEAGMAGALHILDTLLRGARAVRAWTGRVLPPFVAYWVRGETTNWSFYNGEDPPGSGRFSVELLGGERGRRVSTDTDEHDEAIVLHEFGHFVMDRLSSDSSTGGNHPTGYLIDPGLAWEEGRATWFATSVLGSPLYQDTIGLSPRGSLRVDHDLENHRPSPGGIGSEEGVAEILWDLGDGADGLADADEDGVALGPAAVLRAMMDLAQEPGAFPDISSFLGFLVARGRVEIEPLKNMLVRGGHPDSVLPADGPAWPRDLTAPARVVDKIDAVSNPAPSGGPPRPHNGFDAVHVYRVHVEQPSMLFAQLRILGSGRVADQQDLDLELRDIRADMITSSATEKQTEAVLRSVAPGWYVLYVRDGGNGNRVGYELDLRLTPTGDAPAAPAAP